MSVDVEKFSWANWAMEFKRKPLTETLEETYDYFMKRNSIEKIAKIREMKVESIERQIVELIAKSLISVEDVVDEDKINDVMQVIEDENVDKLSIIKDKINVDISYFEIKCVLASLCALPSRIGIDSVKRVRKKKFFGKR